MRRDAVMVAVMVVVVLVGLRGAALGQEVVLPAAPVQPVTMPRDGGADADADADALRGPSVERHEDRPRRSIVQRDFQGRLKRLEEPPVMVALGKLEMGAEERARVEKVVGDRAAALDAIVRDNLRLLIELTRAQEGKDGPAAARLRSEAFEKLQPFLKRGPLMAEVRGALEEAGGAELKRMVDEYNAVAAQERVEDSMSGRAGAPKKENRLGAMLAQGFEGFALEAKASYERVVGAGGKEFERFLAKLQLTPEQDSHIRQRAGDLFQKTYGKTTKKQQFGLFVEIYKELTVEQRHTLAEMIGEENRATWKRSGKSDVGSGK